MPKRLWIKTKAGWMSVDRVLGFIEPGTAKRLAEEKAATLKAVA